MKKPLLSDDVLEEVRKQQFWQEDFPYDLSDGADWEEPYQGYQEGETVRIPVTPSVVKSRRIETLKQEAFRSRVNRILFWVVVLLVLLVLAVLFL